MKMQFRLYPVVISLLFASCNGITRVIQEKDIFTDNQVVVHHGAWEKIIFLKTLLRH